MGPYRVALFVAVASLGLSKLGWPTRISQFVSALANDFGDSVPDSVFFSRSMGVGLPMGDSQSLLRTASTPVRREF